MNQITAEQFKAAQEACQAEHEQTPPYKGKYEQLGVPLYDTANVGPGDRAIYFHAPGGRGEEFTNVMTAGALSWPKKYLTQGIEVRMPLDTGVVGMVVEFCIGEQDVFRDQVAEMSVFEDRERGLKTYAARWEPVWIPTVQNFRVIVDASKMDLGLPQHYKRVPIRCSLVGKLHREFVPGRW